MDEQPPAPLREIRLGRVPARRVVREARRGHDRRPGPQQLEGRLVADLDPRPRDERHPPAEVGRLEALLVVEVGAGRAEGVVEVVKPPVLGLADVARPRVLELAQRLGRPSGEEAGRRGEHLRLARGADARPGEERTVVRLDPAPLRLAERLHEASLLLRLGMHRPAGGHEEPPALLLGQLREQRTIVRHRLEHLPQAPQLLRPRRPRGPGRGGRASMDEAGGRSPVFGHPASLRGTSQDQGFLGARQTPQAPRNGIRRRRRRRTRGCG